MVVRIQNGAVLLRDQAVATTGGCCCATCSIFRPCTAKVEILSPLAIPAAPGSCGPNYTPTQSASQYTNDPVLGLLGWSQTAQLSDQQHRGDGSNGFSKRAELTATHRYKTGSFSYADAGGVIVAFLRWIADASAPTGFRFEIVFNVALNRGIAIGTVATASAVVPLTAYCVGRTHLCESSQGTPLPFPADASIRLQPKELSAGPAGVFSGGVNVPWGQVTGDLAGVWSLIEVNGDQKLRLTVKYESIASCDCLNGATACGPNCCTHEQVCCSGACCDNVCCAGVCCPPGEACVGTNCQENQLP